MTFPPYLVCLDNAFGVWRPKAVLDLVGSITEKDRGTHGARKNKAAGFDRNANAVGGATTGYEAELWEIVDALRGSMDAAEFNHVVLGWVYDPCCGSSGMFVRSIEFIRAHASGNGGKARADIFIYGQESNYTTWRHLGSGDTTMVSEAAIARQLRLGEDSRWELKRLEFRGDRRDDLADELAAFANAIGGLMLCGVTDADEVQGLSRPQRDSPGGSYRRVGSSKRIMSSDERLRLSQQRAQARFLWFVDMAVRIMAIVGRSALVEYRAVGR